MNQAFKLRFDQMRQSDPTDSDAASTLGGHEFHSAPGHTRNLCLVWPDGRRLFLNYAYLIAGEFKPETDKNLIGLTFSSHTVSLQGYSLDSLFTALLDHLPRYISAIDSRYVLEEDSRGPIVVEIRVEKRDD